MLILLSDSSFDVRVSTMTDNLLVERLSQMQALWLEILLDFLTMLWRFEGKLSDSRFFLCFFTPVTTRQPFLDDSHKQDGYRMLLLNKYSLWSLRKSQRCENKSISQVLIQRSHLVSSWYFHLNHSLQWILISQRP